MLGCFSSHGALGMGCNVRIFWESGISGSAVNASRDSFVVFPLLEGGRYVDVGPKRVMPGGRELDNVDEFSYCELVYGVDLSKFSSTAGGAAGVDDSALGSDTASELSDATASAAGSEAELAGVEDELASLDGVADFGEVKIGSVGGVELDELYRAARVRGALSLKATKGRVIDAMEFKR